MIRERGFSSFSMHSDPMIVVRALEAGATGYVIKDTMSEEFVEAFEKVRAGTPHLSNALAMQVALVGTGVHRNPLRNLTPRELEVLSLLAEGKPYSGIAGDLNVSYKTVVNLSSHSSRSLRQNPSGIDPHRRAIAFTPRIRTAWNGHTPVPNTLPKVPVELDNGPETRGSEHRTIHAQSAGVKRCKGGFSPREEPAGKVQPGAAGSGSLPASVLSCRSCQGRARSKLLVVDSSALDRCHFHISAEARYDRTRYLPRRKRSPPKTFPAPIRLRSRTR